jgi:hypothetical protein
MHERGIKVAHKLGGGDECAYSPGVGEMPQTNDPQLDLADIPSDILEGPQKNSENSVCEFHKGFVPFNYRTPNRVDMS